MYMAGLENSSLLSPSQKTNDYNNQDEEIQGYIC